MSPTYEVRLTRSAEKEFKGLQPRIQRQITGRLLELEAQLRPHDSQRLKGTARLDCRIDIGAYRVVYDIDYGSRVITVWRIRHRKDVYRNL